MSLGATGRRLPGGASQGSHLTLWKPGLTSDRILALTSPDEKVQAEAQIQASSVEQPEEMTPCRRSPDALRISQTIRSLHSVALDDRRDAHFSEPSIVEKASKFAGPEPFFDGLVGPRIALSIGHRGESAWVGRGQHEETIWSERSVCELEVSVLCLKVLDHLLADDDVESV